MIYVIILILVFILIGLISITKENLNLPTDPFGRIQTSDPFTMLSLTHTKGKNPTYESEKMVGTGTSVWDSNTSTIKLSVFKDGDKVTRQTIRRNIYQAGKGIIYDFTGNFNTGYPGSIENDKDVITRMGAFDDENGFFLEHLNGKTEMVKRTSVTGTVVETRYPFNSRKYKMLKGKSHIMYLEIQWLGVGSVVMGVKSGRDKYVISKIDHAGQLESTYIKNANLPMRYEIVSNGGAGSMIQICTAVTSEGGYRPDGIMHSISNVELGGAVSTITGAEDNGNRGLIDVDSGALSMGLCIRAKSSYPYNQTTIIPKTISFISTSGGNIQFKILLFNDSSSDPITGGSWTSVEDDSAVEFKCNYKDSFTITDSYNIVESGFANNNDSIIVDINTWSSKLSLGTGLNGPDYLMIVLQALNTNNEPVSCSLTWEEFF
jgi:hypothetical protein